MTTMVRSVRYGSWSVAHQSRYVTLAQHAVPCQPITSANRTAPLGMIPPFACRDGPGNLLTAVHEHEVESRQQRARSVPRAAPLLQFSAVGHARLRGSARARLIGIEVGEVVVEDRDGVRDVVDHVVLAQRFAVFEKAGDGDLRSFIAWVSSQWRRLAHGTQR